MTTLTPMRTKSAFKAGKSKRITRRQAKDLLVQTDDDDESSQGKADEHSTHDLPAQTYRRAAEVTKAFVRGVQVPTPASEATQERSAETEEPTRQEVTGAMANEHAKQSNEGTT
ncbi:uncharacterized protein IUM83_19939 [Phytophthora cinnamomi]|uniref:uncharacterized protein n=1 Tax=Phytophthora cinnamomi TaxID=4785 RepID=UPI003559FDC0|nr:hypothetical protein IUM83_19939 [Phytophthora cinnamomi]